MRKIDLVFRSIGERTSQLALELAKKYIQPDTIHVLEKVFPFSETVRRQLQIDYNSDYVVFLDADCLLMEDMRPFLEETTFPYIDCYVYDKFRGKLHTGVHITRIDLVQEMATIDPPRDDLKYVLRPESRLRYFALEKLQMGKVFKPFHIYHDFHQYYKDIFTKYALRELRSRTEQNRSKLQVKMQYWSESDMDYTIAKKAIAFARTKVPTDSSPQTVDSFIADLPNLARTQLATMKIQEKKSLSIKEVDNTELSSPLYKTGEKVFLIGLNQTFAKRLTKALSYLGYTIYQDPVDTQLMDELQKAMFQLSVLQYFDGIADFCIAPYFSQLEQKFPNSKFILTVREEEEWLEGMYNNWQRKLSSQALQNPRNRLRKKQIQFVYGTTDFDGELLLEKYKVHVGNAVHYFQRKNKNLLVMDIAAGDGWAKLCPFLGKEVLTYPFPS
ncbi:MAG: sulfotransferase [Spirochaetota bacterium]